MPRHEQRLEFVGTGDLATSNQDDFVAGRDRSVQRDGKTIKDYQIRCGFDRVANRIQRGLFR